MSARPLGLHESHIKPHYRRSPYSTYDLGMVVGRLRDHRGAREGRLALIESCDICRRNPREACLAWHLCHLQAEDKHARNLFLRGW